MNVTTAFNMFMKAVLRTRQLPFTVTDIDGRAEIKSMILTRGREALKEAQNQALANGTSELTLDEINEEIAAFRREKRGL
jgi:antitoxin component of RelBE/YafQ-DinJ toxin-antitoxin module